MKNVRMLLLVHVFILSLVTACGNDTTTSSGDSGGTTYTGAMTHSFQGTGRSDGQAASCTFSGTMTVTISSDGTVTSTTDSSTEHMSGACQYLDEVVEAQWSGSADGSSFTMTASATGAHASMTAQASGTYDANSLSGTGSGSVSVTGAGGQMTNFSATYSFSLTAI